MSKTWNLLPNPWPILLRAQEVGTTYGFDTKLGDRRWRHQLGSFRHGRSNHPREGPPHPLIPLGWRWTTLLLLFLQSRNARGIEDIDCDFSGSLAATCKYECEQTGGCTAKYSGPPRSGNTIVSSLSIFSQTSEIKMPITFCLNCSHLLGVKI